MFYEPILLYSPRQSIPACLQYSLQTVEQSCLSSKKGKTPTISPHSDCCDSRRMQDVLGQNPCYYHEFDIPSPGDTTAAEELYLVVNVRNDNTTFHCASRDA